MDYPSGFSVRNVYDAQGHLSIILSAHAARQAVSPKFEGCDLQGRPILTGLKVSSN